jgi:uncharacterized protein (TIGR02246 family)
MDILEDIHAKIKQRLALYVAAAKAKDVEKMVSIFAQDSIFLAPSIEAHGREAIKQVLNNLIKSLITIDIFSTHIFQIGEDIYEMGTNVIIIKQEGNEVEIKGNYITVWTQMDGKWFITKDMLPPKPD